MINCKSGKLFPGLRKKSSVLSALSPKELKLKAKNPGMNFEIAVQLFTQYIAEAIEFTFKNRRLCEQLFLTANSIPPFFLHLLS